MTDYKKPYCALFNRVTDVTEDLQKLSATLLGTPCAQLIPALEDCAAALKNAQTDAEQAVIEQS
ncbi:MAG: hypothetical protein QM689_06020 [Oscillospiraceae bacterium]